MQTMLAFLIWPVPKTALSGGVGDVFPDTVTMGAIDILVHEDDLAAACEVLAQVEDNDVDFDEEE